MSALERSGSQMPLLELIGIDKSFPGVKALSGINLKVMPGKVHVICGENGAGKSTLVKIINGIHQPDAGEIRVTGEKVIIENPLQARDLKISMIFQELNYIPESTIEQHLFQGIEPTLKFGNIDWKTIRRKTLELMKAENLSYSPTTKLRDLTVSDIQMIEILKAVSMDANVILMDEPTSAITDREVETLFSKINILRARGVGFIYISHKLDEIFRIADDITVLRDGQWIDTKPASDLNIDQVISLMVGRPMDNIFPEKGDKTIGETVLEVQGLTRYGSFANVDLHVKRGEVVGMAGLMGAGRTEVARCIFGLDPADEGQIKVHGKLAKIKSVDDAIDKGIAMLSEDRKRFGIIPMRDVTENVMLANMESVIHGGYRHVAEERKKVGDICGSIRVKTPDYQTPIQNLSGGNQQKVILARWMLREPDILILDEPTRGIDVGAKFEIYKIINDLAQRGKAVICISSELPELIGICDRIVVMSQGAVTANLTQGEFDQETIMKAATIEKGKS
ncbi:MAG: sugar ABC transporter ATP-binding protein [Propionivibrio sp.]